MFYAINYKYNLGVATFDGVLMTDVKDKAAKTVTRCLVSAAVLLILCVPAMAAGRLTVFVSITPQKYFIKQVGHGLVDVKVMVPPGANPATYEPRPGQMTALSAARLYFAIGVPFERAWLDRIAAANPKMTIIHTDKNIKKRCMTSGPVEIVKRQDGNCQNGYDPHIWLSPPLVKKQVSTVIAALKNADPVNAHAYTKNGKEFMDRIDALDRELRALFDDAAGSCFMVFHPCWGYFADAYGLTQVPVQAEGKEPKPARMKELIDYAKKTGLRVILVQPQFSSKSARAIADAIGGKIAVADPLAENWLENLYNISKIIKTASAKCPRL